MKTKTIGEILKEERTQHRLSLEDLAKKSRIRLSYLQALESNQFGKLPAATFVKGYIKTYARFFGFDYKPVLAILRRDFKESAKGKLVPRDFIKPTLKKNVSWKPVTVVVMSLVAIFLSLLIYVVIQWYNLTKPPGLKIIKPEEDAVVAAKLMVAGQTESDALVTINSQPVALQPDGSFSLELFLTREGLSTITIEATDRQGKSTVEQRTVRVKF